MAIMVIPKLALQGVVTGSPAPTLSWTWRGGVKIIFISVMVIIFVAVMVMIFMVMVIIFIIALVIIFILIPGLIRGQ